MLSPFAASLVVLAAAPSATPEALLQKGIDALERLDDAGALQALKEARVAAADRPELLARIYVYEGLVWALRGDEKAATDRFRTALIISPGAQLPPGNSPRVEEWWSRAGGLPPAGPDSAPVRVPPAPQRLPGTALRTPRELVVPEDVPRAEPSVRVRPTPAPGDLVGPGDAEGEAPRRGSRRGWVLVPAAVGVGAGVASALFFLDADKHFDEASQTPGVTQARQRQLRAQGERSQLYGLLAAGGAGVAAITSGVLWSVLGGTPEAAPGLAAGLTWDAGGAGVSVRGVLP